VALDGKALCGLHGEEVPGVRLVALCDGEASPVLEVARVVRRPAMPPRAPVREGCYFLTSLPAADPAARPLELVRGHWRIENQLHYVAV
jgi:hypothetical protein